MTDRISSTDDSRKENSPMRHAYRVLTAQEKFWVAALKDRGEAFLKDLDEIENSEGSQELSIARTKIEEAVMWTVKHVTR